MIRNIEKQYYTQLRRYLGETRQKNSLAWVGEVVIILMSAENFSQKNND